MPTNLELKVYQKRMLHHLLKVQSDLGDVKLTSLEDFINAVKTEMDAEDVSYVEKMVAEIKMEK